MSLVHDAAYRAVLEQRIRSLRADSPRKWGKMSVDQMLWHVNASLSVAVGTAQQPAARSALPRPVMKFLVLSVPWPKGAPTAPSFVAAGQYDLETERSRCLALIDTFARQALEGRGVDHPLFGKMSGTDVSRLQAKHLDHHLKQFGV